MAQASLQNKTIAKNVREIFGGEPIVVRYGDENNRSHIDIVAFKDRPIKNVTSYSTLGLSDYPIGYKIQNIELRIEIVGACGSQFKVFPNILSTCAFHIINSNFTCSPGTIFKDVVKMYAPKSPMKHVLFVPPFLWEKEFQTLHFDEKKVAWLLAVPISDSENNYAEEHGANELEMVFEKKQIDVFNLSRESVI